MYYQNIPTEVYIIYDECSSVNFVQEGSFNEIEKKLRLNIINSFVHADPLSVGKRWMSLAPRRFL